MTAARSINVPASSYAVTSGDRVLTALGLGSCVAVILHCATRKIGGMAHPLLPAPTTQSPDPPEKYVGTCIEALLAEMVARGSGTLTAKVVGGAEMFSAREASLDIGKRNVEQARRVLAMHGIPMLAEDVGGSHGRSVWFMVGTGRVVIRTLTTGTRVI